MSILQDTNTIYTKEHGYCRIKVFDLNSEENLPLGEPRLQPADSFLISYFHGEQETHILLDAGKKGQGRQIIVPFLKQNGIYKLDKLILSHAHYDHFGGMIDLLNDPEINVNQIIYSPIPEIAVKNGDVGEPNYIPWMELNEILAVHQSRIELITQQEVGNTIPINQHLFFTIIAVPDYRPAEHGKRTNLNNLNLVLKLNYKHFTALFPGDCAVDQTNQILSSGQSHLINDIFLLKAAHHGGDESTTTEFFTKCNPKMVIMTCNCTVVDHRPSFKENLYHFTKNGAKVYRSDLYKLINIYTDGFSVESIGGTEVFSDRTVFKVLPQKSQD